MPSGPEKGRGNGCLSITNVTLSIYLAYPVILAYLAKVEFARAKNVGAVDVTACVRAIHPFKANTQRTKSTHRNRRTEDGMNYNQDLSTIYNRQAIIVKCLQTWGLCKGRVPVGWKGRRAGSRKMYYFILAFDYFLKSIFVLQDLITLFKYIMLSYAINLANQSECTHNICMEIFLLAPLEKFCGRPWYIYIHV